MWEDVRRCEKMWRWEDEEKMGGWEDVKMRRCEDEKMWRCEDVKMRRCEDEKMWRWEDVKMRRCEDERMWRWEDVKMRRCEDEKMWRWEDVKMRRCEDEKMWRWEDVKMRRCEDERMWRWEDVKMRRCEDERMWRCEDERMWRWEDVLQTPTIGRTLRSDALGKKTKQVLRTSSAIDVNFVARMDMTCAHVLCLVRHSCVTCWRRKDMLANRQVESLHALVVVRAKAKFWKIGKNTLVGIAKKKRGSEHPCTPPMWKNDKMSWWNRFKKHQNML